MIVLAAAAIDAHVHDAEGFSGNAKRAIDAAGADPQLHSLRKRRNAFIHANPDNPAITIDQQWSDRWRLEEEARFEVELVFRVFYATPSV